MHPFKDGGFQTGFCVVNAANVVNPTKTNLYVSKSVGWCNVQGAGVRLHWAVYNK